ncbi:MAG: 3-deoxy-manno-octulosonate cytidylyltransferase [Opitutaceae bacterium]|nr:3-deoxy-manno-octulosonate cytidylyltransferase [Opitutaceae bacterium]
MIAIIAPARLASTRFPEKLLHEIKGKPLILWVAERLANQVPEIPRYFAVDHPRLKDTLEQAGFLTIMTRSDHTCGTDRLAEANESIGADLIINVQGDEPLVTRGQIKALETRLQNGSEMATLATPFEKWADFLDPNQVKVVVDSRGRALYFSRSAIPYVRDREGEASESTISNFPAYRHLGLYGYSSGFLNLFCSLPKTTLEETEKLEQLRALENGYSIDVDITEDPSIGVDTIEDADAFQRLV